MNEAEYEQYRQAVVERNAAEARIVAVRTIIAELYAASSGPFGQSIENSILATAYRDIAKRLTRALTGTSGGDDE